MTKIEELIQKVAELRERDVSHPELGVANNFEEAEGQKRQLLAHLDSILGLALQLHSGITRPVLDTALQPIEKALGAVNKDVENIESTIALGIHTPEFPKKRQSFHEATLEHLKQFQATLHPFETTLRLAKLETAVTGDMTVEAMRRELQSALTDVARGKAEIEKALNNVRDNVTSKAVADVETGFSNLARGHAARERAWFIAFVAASVVLAVVIVWAAFGPATAASTGEAILVVFRRLLLVSAAAIFLRLALGKYNAERNLKIIYDHRGAVLSQYSLFESAIGEDGDGRVAKNQLRLELAKYIFADPSTGYISTDAAADININPVISTVERLLPKP